MNYLAQMLRDCSKSRTTTFSEISFTITQEVENKIKNKNFNLRRKMKQRLTDMQKNTNFDDKKQQNSTLGKKPVVNQKPDKEVIPYIEAYTTQNNYYIDSSSLPFNSAAFDQRQAETSVNLYLLMRKKKAIFKIEEIRRKLRSKENLRRFSLKECDCCQRVGKHRCQHKYCEGNCQKLKKSERMMESAQDEEHNGQQPCLQNIRNNEVCMENQGEQSDQKNNPKQIVKEEQQGQQLNQPQNEQYLKKVERQKAEGPKDENKMKEEEKQANQLKEEQYQKEEEEENYQNSSFSQSERQQAMSPEIRINDQLNQSEERSLNFFEMNQQQENKEKE